MQTKFKRYMATSKGMFSTTSLFCLDAVILSSPEERELIERFDRWSGEITLYGTLEYDEDEFNDAVRSLTFASLARGVRFEYKRFNSVIPTEQLILQACKTLLGTVELLATFDGTERVVEMGEQSTTLVAAG